MGMIAHYYQVSKDKIKDAQMKIALSYNDFSEVISSEDFVIYHIDIDKSWLNLVEVFKDIQAQESIENVGELAFYGKEIVKNFQPDGLINFLNSQDVHLIQKYLEYIAISNKEEFIGKFNSTAFTQFGKIDYSESYDYMYNHFMDLKNFYLKCEQEESGVIVSIG